MRYRDALRLTKKDIIVHKLTGEEMHILDVIKGDEPGQLYVVAFNIHGPQKLMLHTQFTLKTKTAWVSLLRRTNEPKLSYMRHRLTQAGIPNVRRGKSWWAPIIQIPESYQSEAYSILDERWSEKRFGFDPKGGTSLDDIPDDDPRFVEWKEQKKLSAVA